jgi:hypothetical protein
LAKDKDPYPPRCTSIPRARVGLDVRVAAVHVGAALSAHQLERNGGLDSQLGIGIVVHSPDGEPAPQQPQVAPHPICVEGRHRLRLAFEETTHRLVAAQEPAHRRAVADPASAVRREGRIASSASSLGGLRCA